MSEVSGYSCFACKKPLETRQVAPQLAVCVHCGDHVITDDRFQEAVAIATANEAWIEKIYWRENPSATFAILKFLLIDFPLTTIVYVGPFLSLCSLALISNYFGPPALSWWQWLCIPVGFVIVYFLLRWLRSGLRGLFASQYANAINLIVSSRGLVIISTYSKPLFLPWPCIVNYAWMGHVTSMSSQMRIDYKTADDKVASINLVGDEFVQPLGELVDILKARLGR